MSKKIKKELQQFFVLEYDWNQRKKTFYDVLPYFRNCWNDKRYNFEKNKVTNKEELSEWIKRASLYNFWSRCQYEFVMGPWPYREEKIFEDMVKIDVHEQLMPNLPILTNILAEEFNIQ